MTPFFANTSGSIGMITGVAFALVATAVGGAIDYSNAMSKRATLQHALDQAAFTVAMAQGEEPDRKKAGAVWMDANFPDVCGSDPEFGIDDDTVTGEMTCNVGTFILGIVGMKSIAVNVVTEVGVGPPGGAGAGLASGTCLYIMHPSAAGALDKGGGGTIYSPACGIHINSSSLGALSVGGGGIDALNIAVVGGANASCMTHRCKATPVVGSPPAMDPMKTFAVPPTGACEQTNYEDSQAGDRVVTEGVYCGGMDFAAGNTHFEPGLYVIRNGLLQQGGGGNWTGKGVTFRFEGNGRISKRGGGDITFSAPTSGDYAGVVLYQGESSQDGLTQDFGGGGDKAFEGVVHLPGHTVSFGGGGKFGSSVPWTAWIVRRLILGGGGDLTLRTDMKASTVPLPQKFDILSALPPRLVLKR